MANITVENVSQTSIYVKAQSNYYNAKTFEWYLDNVYKATETGTNNGSGYYYDYYTFTGLSAGRTYKISVKVKNNKGVVVEEDYIYATTQSAQPPSAPSAYAVPISKSKIDVYWDSVSNATGYHLYLNNVYQATVTGTSYSFTGLSEYTQYTVGVQAYNGNGSSSITTQTVRTKDETPPSVSITSISKTNNSITMSFTGYDAHSGVSGFYVYLNDSHRTTVYGTSGSYTYSGLQSGTTYKVSVKAFDNSGNVSAEDYRNIQASASPPSSPSITAVPISKSKIDVYWDSVSNATGYHLYLNNVYQATVTGTSYSFTGLSEYTQYTVGVQAYNGNGSSSITTQTVRTKDETPPSVSITSISKTNNSITMSFTGYDAHSGVSGFYVYLNDSHRTTVYGTSGSYTYSGLQSGTTYKVSVKAFDNSGNVSAEDYRNIQTSVSFEWDTPKTSGGYFNITAAEWNRFLDAINSARAGKGLTAYNFTYASKGGDFYAYMFNQAVQAISAMNPPISPPSTRSSGDEIYASYFNRLRDSLNSI